MQADGELLKIGRVLIPFFSSFRMMPDSVFHELIERLRRGDVAAADELYRGYGEQLRRMVRIHLTDSRLRRRIDSADICQSVFGNFFLRMALGQFDIPSTTDLLHLLKAMARNRVAHHAKKQRAARRDVRRDVPVAVDDLDLPATDESPSQIIASQDLITAFFQRLDDENRAIADQRRQGRGWDEIGTALGRSGEAVRKQYQRALQRISHELGIEDLISWA